MSRTIEEKPWIVWRLWNAFVSNGLSMGGAVTDTAIGAVMYESITHAALVGLITAEDLVPGKQYLITDYKTTFTLNISGDPYTDASVEAIVVTALTDASLEPIAYSISHPKDILYYDVDGTTYMPGSTRGCIYRRIDTEKNISVPFDFRNFKVEVGEPIIVDYDSGQTYTRGQVRKESGSVFLSKKDGNTGNSTGNAEWWVFIGYTNEFLTLKAITVLSESLSAPTSVAGVYRPFNWNAQNFVIQDQPTTISETLFYMFDEVSTNNITAKLLDNCYFKCEVINNYLGVLSNTVVLSGGFSDNTIERANGLFSLNGIFNNTISKGFNNNFISSASGNTIAADATGNIIGEAFRDNTIGLRFQNNTIGTNFGGQADNYGNQIGNDFHDNVIGNYFSGNVIGNWFYMNTVGNDCQENNLPYKFYSNTTGDSFQNWNGQHYLNGVDFTLLTLPVSGATKYIFYDPTEFNSWGYYDNGVFTITAF